MLPSRKMMPWTKSPLLSATAVVQDHCAVRTHHRPPTAPRPGLWVERRRLATKELLCTTFWFTGRLRRGPSGAPGQSGGKRLRCETAANCRLHLSSYHPYVEATTPTGAAGWSRLTTSRARSVVASTE